jgi:hypothetical protein
VAEDGPGKNYKKSKNAVDWSFGYDSPIASPTPTPNRTDPKDFDENFPIARPNLPKMEENVPQQNQDNSILGGFMNFMDNIVPDDMGGALRGDSGFIADVPFVGDLYRNTVGTVLNVPLTAGEAGIDALNWGSEQMNHLGSALVSWMPGGIQTLTWDQSHDVSFGQAFVASMGQTAGRLERNEAQLGDILMLPFSLLSLGAAQIDTDNIAQDKDFDVLKEEQLDTAFGSGVGQFASGGLDAAWLIAADPTILAGGGSMWLRLGAKGTKFGGLTNQALRRVEQVNSFAMKNEADALLIAERGIEGARSSGLLTPQGENLIELMVKKESELGNNNLVTRQNKSNQAKILSFLGRIDEKDPVRSALVVNALAGHQPSWVKLSKLTDPDGVLLYDDLAFANGIDLLGDAIGSGNKIDVPSGNFAKLTDEQVSLGDRLVKIAEDELTGVATMSVDDIGGQLITRGGNRLSGRAVRAANAYRAGKSESGFATGKKVEGQNLSGHFVYDTIQKFSGSRPVTIIRWAGQGSPNGIVMLKDSSDGGVKEVKNWLRKSKIDANESAIFFNSFVEAKTPAAKELVLRQMEEAAVQAIAKNAGMTVDNAVKLYKKFNQKRAMALDEARKTQTVFHKGDTEVIKLPSFYAEVGNAIPMIDTKLFTKVINENKTLLMTGEATAALDVFNSLWKISVLLRLGYTQRNIVEGFLRSVAVMGIAASNPKALGNSFANSARYVGMKRGLKIERNIMKDLETQRDLLRANEALLITERDAWRVRMNDRIKRDKARTARGEVLAPSTIKKRQTEDSAKIAEMRLVEEEINRDLARVVAAQDELNKAAAYTKTKNESRRRTGYKTNKMDDGEEMAGSFQGTQGDMALLNSNSSKTQQETFQNANQRRINDLEGDHTLKIMDPMKLNADQMLDYWEYYTQLINRRYIGDPLAELILKDTSVTDIMAWFKTTEGARYFETVASARRAKSGGSKSKDDAAAFLNDAMDALRNELPVDSKLRALVVERQQSGTKLTVGEVNANAPSKVSELPGIPGRLAEDGGMGLFKRVAGIPEKGSNWAMKWLATIPENNLLRHPFYSNMYNVRQRELYALAASQGRDVGLASVKASINKSAHADALRATKDTMYTIEELSNAAVLLRFVSPFFPAWENSIRTWGRITYENPAVLGAGNILWNIPNNMGWVVDEDGNKVEKSSMLRDENHFVVYPEPIANFLRKNIGPFTPGESLMTRQQGFNVIFPGGEPWFPGVGPMTQIPAALLLRGKPEDQELLKNLFGEELYSQILPSGNANADLVDMLSPTIVRRVKQMYSGESSDSAYLTLYNQIMEDSYIKAQLENRSLGDKDFKAIEDKVNKFWKWQVLAAGVAFTQSIYSSPNKLQRDAWNKLIDDNSIPYAKKLEMFTAQFGSDYDAITRSDSITETKLQPNLTTWSRISKNKDLVNQLYQIDPEIVGMFGNMGSFDDPFSFAVMGEFTATKIGGKPIRGKLKPSDINQKNEIADGWREWRKVKDAVDEELIKRGLSSLQVNDAKPFVDILYRFEQELTARYPAWNVEKESYNDKLPKFIEGARKIVENGNLVGEDSTVAKIADYLKIRETIVEEVRKADGDDAVIKNIKLIGYAAAFQFRQEDIGFADFYDQYFASDDFREI